MRIFMTAELRERASSMLLTSRLPYVLERTQTRTRNNAGCHDLRGLRAHLRLHWPSRAACQAVASIPCRAGHDRSGPQSVSAASRTLPFAVPLTAINEVAEP